MSRWVGATGSSKPLTSMATDSLIGFICCGHMTNQETACAMVIRQMSEKFAADLFLSFAYICLNNSVSFQV